MIWFNQIYCAGSNQPAESVEAFLNPESSLETAFDEAQAASVIET